MNIPNDPVILMSFLNTHMRDYGENLHELCARLGLDEEKIKEKLGAAGFEYSTEHNRFL
ncbi:MAG: DUF4250 domain-containing protein [Clostridiales bacterium]|nr:DUF4250 domain-containing protein [Clostridiales bacterium]